MATFVTQTTQSLQQDYSLVTASLLTEMVSLQRAVALGGDVRAVPSSALNVNTPFNSSFRDICLNGLWLVSLALTLAIALVAGIIKQWLHFCLVEAMGSPKHRACVRHFRFTGFKIWHVEGIIELLPVLMNASLLLFFLGLILYTQDLSGAVGVTWTLVGLTAFSFLLYLGSSFIPVLIPQCPYKTSLTKLFFGTINICWQSCLKLFV